MENLYQGVYVKNISKTVGGTENIISPMGHRTDL